MARPRGLGLGERTTRQYPDWIQRIQKEDERRRVMDEYDSAVDGFEAAVPSEDEREWLRPLVRRARDEGLRRRRGGSRREGPVLDMYEDPRDYRP